MRGIFTQILKVARTDSTVLISGESGTGKELVGSGSVRTQSSQGQAFYQIECVAIPEGLLESELFGHEKGAFTGATAQKIGKFELAHEGTIFLDEIGDMPLPTQAKILRVLQEKEFERVGGNQTIRVDVRFIAATNKNLLEMVKTGNLPGGPLLPPQRLFDSSAPPAGTEGGYPCPGTALPGTDGESRHAVSQSLQLLTAYSWPGNIRELQKHPGKGNRFDGHGIH